jgi:hypothetical protein
MVSRQTFVFMSIRKESQKVSDHLDIAASGVLHRSPDPGALVDKGCKCNVDLLRLGYPILQGTCLWRGQPRQLSSSHASQRLGHTLAVSTIRTTQYT